MAKKIISIFLILLFVLQLLPIKQVVQYFSIDNLVAEEISHPAKAASKNFSAIDEDAHLIHGHHFLLDLHFPASAVTTGIYKAMLPSSHADDIETPPPNAVIS